MLNRRTTRTILNTLEVSSITATPSEDTLAFPLSPSDSFYIGFHGRFASRYVQLKTANTNPATVSLSYWNGADWKPVLDFQDQTAGFTRSGFLAWENVEDWEASALNPVTDQSLFWLKITVDQSLSAETELQSVLNLFSDDLILRQYYPELVSDSRYKPLDELGVPLTHFLWQHLAAKEEIVRALKRRRIIEDESQILDINEVAIAATHACAWIILNPIATSDSVEKLAKRAFDNFSETISELSLSTDQDGDGIISESERESLSSTPSIVRRG